MKNKTLILLAVICLYSAFILFSFIFDYKSGIQIGNNLIKYSINIIAMLPFVFIIIGLFEAWVKRKTVERHLGKDSNFLGYLWAVLLGGTTLGPMIVALPIAHSLYGKGAKLSIVFTYIGAACVCRIPMTVFEASYLGIKFTIIRYSVSIPLIIFSSMILGNFLQRKDFRMKCGT